MKTARHKKIVQQHPLCSPSPARHFGRQVRFSFLLLALAPFLSCTKDITIDLPEVEQKIVVEGGIEPGQYPWVILTKSVGYFDPVDSASLAQNIITDATVIVSNGVISDTLDVTFDPNYFIPIVYKGSTLVGQAGGTYTLTVTTPDGKSISSVTTIPQPLPLDSLWFKVETSINNNDSLGFAWAHMSDPSGFGNGYRWFAKRLGKDAVFVPPLGSAFDDKFIDGKSFDFAYNRGSLPGSSAPDDNNSERGYFKLGDTIAVKFCTIGTREVDFFRTYEIEVGNNGNPFAAPGVVRTNIEGGLGVWCGYGVALDTIVAQ